MRYIHVHYRQEREREKGERGGEEDVCAFSLEASERNRLIVTVQARDTLSEGKLIS